MPLSDLAHYSSSDEDECASPPVKKRKLPTLPSALKAVLPVDDPALHQGRVRTSPHVEGQFAACVYIPLVIHRRSPLCKLLIKAYKFSNAVVPTLHPIALPDHPPAAEKDCSGGQEDVVEADIELHVSLTRPTYLRAHQREDLKRAVKVVARSHCPFAASFASFSELTNDEKTRMFLGVEVGAGHSELKSMSDNLAPTLRSIKQQEFYAEPRFHASFAWALLHNPEILDARGERISHTVSRQTGPLPTPLPSSFGLMCVQGQGTVTDLPTQSLEVSQKFATIASFPKTLVPSLNSEFGEKLTTRHVGTFDAREICVRIGKEVSKWKLAG